MAYSSWSVVFGEQPSAAKWNILGTNDASFNDGTGIANGAILPNHLKASASSLNTHVWDSWTPTWTNFTIGNATQAGKFIQIGKTVHFFLLLTFGSTSATSASSASFTLPVSIHSSSTAPWTFGQVTIKDVSAGANYYGLMETKTAADVYPLIANASSTYLQMNGLVTGVPMTWATGDLLYANGTYQAA